MRGIETTDSKLPSLTWTGPGFHPICAVTPIPYASPVLVNEFNSPEAIDFPGFIHRFVLHPGS